jgi:aspartate racemase
MGELVHGRLRPEPTAAVRRVVERLAADGCDAVVLGCTELPLILDDARSPLPTLTRRGCSPARRSTPRP